MTYFTQDFIDFFSELANNNEREWFNANKKRFKENCEKPFLKLVEELIDRAAAIDSGVNMAAKEGMFRIYRDTRFAKDKTPYKTHMSAVICEGGRKGMKAGGVYLEANHEHFKIYSGFYQPGKEDLQKVREAIASDLGGFEALISDADFKKHFGEIQGEENKRIPKEFKEVAEKQPLIVKKSFYYFNKMKPQTILKDDLVDVIMEHYMVSKPLGDFFLSAVKS